jgi:hypothetical protein
MDATANLSLGFAVSESKIECCRENYTIDP